MPTPSVQMQCNIHNDLSYEKPPAPDAIHTRKNTEIVRHIPPAEQEYE